MPSAQGGSSWRPPAVPSAAAPLPPPPLTAAATAAAAAPAPAARRMPALDRASRASAATLPLGRGTLARSAIGSWVLRVATAAALGIDAAVHWQNASAYDAVTG